MDMAIFIGPIMVIIGWFVVYNFAKITATRNETKSIIDDCLKIINEITILGKDFWFASRKERPDIHIYETHAISLSTKLYSRFTLLQSRGVKLDSTMIDDLIETLTLNCELVDNTANEERISKVYKIIQQSENATVKMYDIFSKQYQPTLFKKNKKFNLDY